MENGGDGNAQLPQNAEGAFVLPVLVIRNRVLFPGGLLRLSVARPKSIRLVEMLLAKQAAAPLRPPSQVALTIVTQLEAKSGGGGDSEGAAAGSSGGGRGRTESGRGTAVADEAGEPPRQNVGVTGNSADKSGGAMEDNDNDNRMLFDSIYKVGCAAKIVQIAKADMVPTQAGGAAEAPRYSLLVQGVARVSVRWLAQESPVLFGTVAYLRDVGSPSDPRVKALALNLRDAAQGLLEAVRARSAPRGLQIGGGNGFGPNGREALDAAAAAAPGVLADILASGLGGSVTDRQAILEEVSLEKRLLRVLELVREQTQVLVLSNKIRSEVEGKMTSRTREFLLRQQLKAIRDELGETADGDGAGDDDDLGALQKALDKAQLPPEVSKSAARDMRRLKRMQPQQPEHSVLRNYLEVLSELPWAAPQPDARRLVEGVRAALDRDHAGLDKVKRRVVEYMAVRSLRADNRGSILCLVGPPGVGKTSLGRSVATALGRPFQRLSLGGVHDEAEIRGHRRTYIGAMPGSIVQCLRKAGSRNAVVLLDEVDKLGTNFRGGDPASALLEVLDPEQNSTFTDHYLNVPFDLSSVFFIATANQLDTIPAPLLDRMEVIHVAGYTTEEKLAIATRHLLPKQLREHGLTPGHALVPPRTLLRVAASYTREAGVRQLEREIAAICRHVALKVAEWQEEHQPVALPDPEVPASDGGGKDGGQAEQQQAPDGAHAGRGRGHRSHHMTAGELADTEAATAAAAAAPGTTASSDEKDGANAAPAADTAAKAAGSGGTPVAMAETDDRAPESTISPLATAETAANAADAAAAAAVAAVTAAVPSGTPVADVTAAAACAVPFTRVVVTPEMLPGMLGPEKHESEVAARVAVPGVCTGLAWTPAGGELLFIECSSMVGKGRLTLTGKLGETMKESALIALSWIRSHEAQICQTLGLPTNAFPDDFSAVDLHVHVPAGGIPKDGPSAGVAIATALLSLLSGRAVDPLLAMTGELTLRGLVLPVGGIKSKVLAAHRGGVRHVVLPARNAKDLDELPPRVRQEMRFSMAATLADVVAAAFPPPLAAALAPEDGGAAAAAVAATDDAPAALLPSRSRSRSRMPQAPPAAAAAAAAAGEKLAAEANEEAVSCGPVLHSFL